MPKELQEKLTNIRNRYAKKVDSLNWQSISYQKKADELFNQQTLELFASELLSLLDEVEKMVIGEDRKHLDKSFGVEHFFETKNQQIENALRAEQRQQLNTLRERK